MALASQRLSIERRRMPWVKVPVERILGQAQRTPVFCSHSFPEAESPGGRLRAIRLFRPELLQARARSRDA